MENLDQTYKRLLSENKKEETCKGCGEKMSKCSCNTVKEELKGGQKNLDKNHNGELDDQDFKILRNKKKKVVSETADEPPFDKPYKTTKGVITDKSGAKHGPMSRARDLARSSLNKHLNATYNEYNPEKDKLKKQHFGMAEETQVDEAFINGREYASHGLMHPDHAKHDIHQPANREVDFYASKTGDKMHGRVMKNDGKQVHIQANKELGDGKLHKFKVTPHLPKQVDEVLKPSMGAAAYIDDFVHSKNPQFAGKSSEKRRQMALAAFYAAKKGMKEEAELEEGMYSSDVERAFPNGKASGVKTHAPVAPVPPKKKEQMKPRVGHPTNMKEEVEQLDEKIYADDYHSTSETSQFGGHRPHVIAKDTGKTMYLGQHAYKTPKHAIEHAQAYLSAYSKTGMHGADRASTAYATANKHNHHINEAKDPKEYDLYSEMDESTTETNKYTIAEDNIDEAWMLRQKKKEKKPVKEENMKSFRDFLQDINEVKMADLPVRKIQGRSYGNQPEEDDEEDKPTQSAEKRGRGRPAGAKSGAKQIGSASKQKSGVEYTGYKLHLPNSNK